MPEKESQATISESSHVQWSFIQQKAHLCLLPCSVDNVLNTKRPSSAHEKVLILGKYMLVCFRDHSHIESSHSLCQIDATGWVDLALWCYDFTHEISNFVKILFNLKKKNISLNRGKPENSFIAKNQKFELITSCYFKNLISTKPTWNSLWSLISSRHLKR